MHVFLAFLFCTKCDRERSMNSIQTTLNQQDSTQKLDTNPDKLWNLQ